MNMEKNMKGLFCCFAVALATIVALAGEATMPVEECRRGSADGDAEAQYQLGLRYEAGDGVKKNAMRAVGEFRKAADQGHKKACVKLAGYYESGEVVGKNAAIAAKYRALAEGGVVVETIREAEPSKETDHAAERENQKAAIDEALDYIYGRNGKTKDPAMGLRLIYDAAKDNPEAQFAFCQAWSVNAVDITELDDHEWEIVIPWFGAAFKDGLHKCGLILGIDAFGKKNWQAAIKYWTAAGNAGIGGAWYFVGSVLCGDFGHEALHGPKSLHDERRAKEAFEKAVKADWGGVDQALLALGQICLFAEDKGCHDYPRAFRIFTSLIQAYPNDRLVLFGYGWAGILSHTADDNRKIEQMDRKLRIGFLSSQERREIIQEREALNRKIEDTVRDYMVFIKRSADMGYEAAQRGLRHLQQSYRR